MDSNFAEVQGQIINSSIKIENLINRILHKYFKPQNGIVFLSVVLNSSVMSYGGKLKVLSAIGLEKDVFEKLLKLGSIRNSFAHTNESEDYSVLFDESGGIFNSDSSKVLHVMNAKGNIKSKNVSQLQKDFLELYTETELQLQNLYLQQI